MTIKEFFKPSMLKIIIFVLIWAIIFFIPKPYHNCYMTELGVNCGVGLQRRGIGYPIVCGDVISGDMRSPGFHPINFMINLFVYYPLSCIIIFVYEKIKK